MGSGWNVLLVGPHGVHTVGEFLGLGIVGQLALHPDGIGVGGESDGAVDGALAAALVAVVALARAGSVPVEVDVLADDGLGNGAGLGVALALGFGVELLNQTSLVSEAAGVDGISDSFAEELDAGFVHPFFFDGAEFIAGEARVFGFDHQVVEGLERGVCGALDEGMVTGIDGGGDEGGGFGVSTSNGEEIGS